ncbi:hypothetical protein HPP92_013433 [Vanilla planifolia]|uniref:Increased DNA methylation 1 C-terminal domain-containing protein n=1 Tax=Vanilla planifolia TaxID=51239 RepID=A0A835QU18_VANPL|nr:hypothetical protein HPP92_013433 [Vanilla planifolia]
MLLMKGEEVVCVATFRIFGEKLAEMPFICTRVKFRRQECVDFSWMNCRSRKAVVTCSSRTIENMDVIFWIHKDDIFRVVRTTKSHISHISWYSHVSQVLEEAIYFKLLINRLLTHYGTAMYNRGLSTMTEVNSMSHKTYLE